MSFFQKQNCQWQFFWKKMTIFGNCFEKMSSFWQLFDIQFPNLEKKRQFLALFFWKKCHGFGNFLTFKWQYSGGSDTHAVEINYFRNIEIRQEFQIMAQIWVVLAPNVTNLGLFRSDFSTVWLTDPKRNDNELRYFIK